MTIDYEWDVETVTTTDTVEFEAEEVVEHRHFNTFSEAYHEASKDAGLGFRHDIVLVRDGPYGRSWAHLIIPVGDAYYLMDSFYDADGTRATLVPARFHDEVAKQYVIDNS